ncbi:MAG TPA: sulfite exporter TauE/SafE family protein [Anaeromyxobacteraceae bacterium]|nr:sulfite exporter TauE/SafE family protein [Anaeromyxobacteraceae bacterium]
MLGALIGLAGGIFGGLVGLGGGVVMVPLLVGLARLRQREAHGTSLVTVVLAGIAGAVTYASRGAVDLTGAALLALTAILTAHFGARYAHVLPDWKLKRTFGGFLLAMSLLLLAKPWLTGAAAPLEGWGKAVVLLPVGAVTGFLSGMMGVGGGNFMVPAMVLLAGYQQVVAQGTSLLAMVPAGAVGALAHWQLGNVVQRLLPGLAAGILVGAFLGGSVALRLPEQVLRPAFVAVLLWAGLRYVRAPRPAAAAPHGGDHPRLPPAGDET